MVDRSQKQASFLCFSKRSLDLAFDASTGGKLKCFEIAAALGEDRVLPGTTCSVQARGRPGWLQLQSENQCRTQLES